MSFLASMSRPARIGLLSGTAAILLLTAVALWWLLSPRQRLMLGNLREHDAAEIVQALDEWKVPYQIVDGGAGIAVDDDLVYETRMKLVSAGVPRGGHVGFELFDDADFGVTEFAQRINYQRALQGEIERTIAALPGVETARVHLTIQRAGLLGGERETSKASVAVTLTPGGQLERAQVDGIRSLVAAAVEGLSTDAVSVLDSNGALLAGGKADAHGVRFDLREDEEARLEARIQARVVELLRQVLRDEDFRVSVDATLNFDAVREVHERPLLHGAATTAADKAKPGATVPEQGGVAREEISRAPGRVERLSVAAILPPGLDDAEVERIRSLIVAAAGIDVERGDRIEVSQIGRQATGTVDVDVEAYATPVPNPIVAAHAASGTGMQAALPWLLLAAGLVLGGAAMRLARRPPRALKAAERDAMLARMRTWLADGGTLP